MAAYYVQCDLGEMSERLSRALGGTVDVADAREILMGAGFVEYHGGWLASDLRPLMLALINRPGWLSGPLR